MAWEELPVQAHQGSFNRIEDDEVSVIASKIKNSVVFRLNSIKENFGGAAFVSLKIDREKKRVGFFKTTPEKGRKVVGYGKVSRLMYVSAPKILGELGFKHGRYEVLRLKTPPSDMLFFIAADRKKPDREAPQQEGKDENGDEATA